MVARYPVPWIATYFLAAIALVAGSFLIVWFLDGLSFDYERDDPDFEFMERIARSASPHEADFSALNGGDWQALCLLGSRADIEAAMKSGGLDDRQRATLRDAYEGEDFVLDASEFVFAYVDKAGAGKALRHPHGFAFAHSASAKCTVRERPVLQLPVGP